MNRFTLKHITSKVNTYRYIQYADVQCNPRGERETQLIVCYTLMALVRATIQILQLNEKCFMNTANKRNNASRLGHI